MYNLCYWYGLNFIVHHKITMPVLHLPSNQEWSSDTLGSLCLGRMSYATCTYVWQLSHQWD